MFKSLKSLFQVGGKGSSRRRRKKRQERKRWRPWLQGRLIPEEIERKQQIQRNINNNLKYQESMGMIAKMQTNGNRQSLNKYTSRDPMLNIADKLQLNESLKPLPWETQKNNRQLSYLDRLYKQMGYGPNLNQVNKISFGKRKSKRKSKPKRKRKSKRKSKIY